MPEEYNDCVTMPNALLVSTYEMGRQPFGLASAAAWLRADGWDVTSIDAAKEKLTAAHLTTPDLIAFHLPMHTATRLAGPAIEAARRLNPSSRICAFGLYAPLNDAWLRSIGVDATFGGEFEEDLVAFARTPSTLRTPSTSRTVPRIHFLVPDRTGLPPLSK